MLKQINPTIVLTLILGIVIGAFSYSFIGKYSGEEKNKISSVTKEYDLMLKNQNFSYLFQDIQSIVKQDFSDFVGKKDYKGPILKPEYDTLFDSLIRRNKDTMFNRYNSKGNSMFPIADEFYMAFRKILYITANSNNEIIHSARTSQTLNSNDIATCRTMPSNSWIWISKKDLLKFTYLLYTADFERDSLNISNNGAKIDGTRVYLGYIDTTFFTSDYLNQLDSNMKDYLTLRQGSIVPMFVATECVEGSKIEPYTYDSELLAAQDCNCGFPPGYCAKGSKECSSLNKCKKCSDQ